MSDEPTAVLVRPWERVLVNLVLVLTLGLWPVGRVPARVVLALTSQWVLVLWALCLLLCG